ncbi:MAG: DNA repair protein RadC [Prevotellaceae bacterium]|jgi:DNA repair protein RadC|nr:DNA repair protein RadC [Prevotellaceae bacterium]
MSALKIKDWNPADRPREKLLAGGAAALTDAELIAILLRSGAAAETAVEVAQRVLALANHNLRELGKVDYARLKKIKGIGDAKAVTLLAALELGRRRAATDAERKTTIRSAADVVACMGPRLADLPHEELWSLLLNRANQVLEKCKISQGGLHATVTDVRLILKPAIEKVAAGLVLVHNHPSANPTPSPDDRLLTERVKKAAELFDIRIIDHVIVAGNDYYSFAEQGAV